MRDVRLVNGEQLRELEPYCQVWSEGGEEREKGRSRRRQVKEEGRREEEEEEEEGRKGGERRNAGVETREGCVEKR